MRRWGIVVALAIAGTSSARAGTQEDAKEQWADDASGFGAPFEVPTDKMEDIVALVKNLELEETDLPLDTPFYWFSPVDHHLTATIESDDGDVCRGAVVVGLLDWREDELLDGRRAGFTYEITCGPWTFTGRWGAFGTEDGIETEGYGELQLTQAQGDDRKDYHSDARWPAVLPDVTDPAQWARATLWVVDEIESELDRISYALEQDNSNGSTIEDKAAEVLGEIDEQIARLETFDVLDGGEALLAAEKKWLTSTKTDLARGDLHKYIARYPTGTTPYKVYVKKLKAIRKKWKKGRARRDAALDKVATAFAKAHP